MARRIVAGPYVRAACERHLRDLKEGHKRGLRWDLAAAMRAVNFFGHVLRLEADRPFILHDWQVFVVGSLFGWMGPDGYRRFRLAFIETGKGSGKTPLAAGIGLYMLVADGEPRAECYAGAVKKDQAMVLFRDAVAMVYASPHLRSRLEMSGGTGREWNIAYLRAGSFFRPISTENQGRGQSGPRPQFGVLDEIHEHSTNAMVEHLRAGVKNRRQALILMITNSGVGRQGVCWDYHEAGAKIAEGKLVDDSFFAYICALDPGDDPFEDPSCWPKANPSIGITFQPKYLEERIASARGMPSMRALVLRLNFCVWVDAASPWIDGDLWRACERPEGGPPARRWAGFEAVRERPGYLGLDLSSTQDLTALAAVWPREEGDEAVDAAVWVWTPADTLAQREARDMVPYGLWRDEGHISAVPGRSIDYGHVVQHIAEMLADGFRFPSLAFDQWKINDFLREMDRAGLEGWVWDGKDDTRGIGLRLVKHGQGFMGPASAETLWMPRSIAALENAVLKGQLRVRKNPALTWASASAVLHTDPAGNKKWEKRKSTGRIDPLVALCMALGLAKSAPQDGMSGNDAFVERGLYIL